MEDIDIVIKAVNGNKDAFAELIHLRENKLYKIAYMYVKNEQQALDIVGETVYFMGNKYKEDILPAE